MRGVWKSRFLHKNLKFDGVDGNFYFQDNLIERELGILQINKGQNHLKAF